MFPLPFWGACILVGAYLGIALVVMKTRDLRRDGWIHYLLSALILGLGWWIAWCGPPMKPVLLTFVLGGIWLMIVMAVVAMLASLIQKLLWALHLR